MGEPTFGIAEVASLFFKNLIFSKVGHIFICDFWHCFIEVYAFLNDVREFFIYI